MNRLRKIIEEHKAFCSDTDSVYSPNSINHLERRPFLDEANTKLELERLRGFLEFLFDHSEHCDHISYVDAWYEFEEYEMSHSYFMQTKIS